ncbi:LptF/LptG family permease [Reichenbachiella agariperforans]|uniref:Lipopolysaccharide export system permease protein n=1 Tax=Reichenbachiella agariperforans TaxID=156994 RepID=A0A1M6VG98_REIAG|nr:LptF/LptG family permease [Reichenbachiella agariperforans]MBU2914889.1 LptF/LptG family permease [Reichenbachiella agariperforans]SHK80488.1 lipopolysaccharide export system permease protein [Reichenbachiella agariperforans]
MKKLDKLILQSFIGPFILTFLVAVFILLIQYMLKYFDDFIGKDLGFGVFGELMMYFSINMVPMALPLAILISSLMTYGKLGEHFELTAIKSAGISLPRVLLPTFILVIFISIGAFFLNNYLVPHANLRAYSLLYDIKQQKPALDLKEGQFYAGIPDYSIKIREKHKDGIAMSDVVIYDHTNSNGNKKVILADSCRMYTFINDRYLMMELYRGNHYVEEETKSSRQSDIPQLVRTKFDRMDIVFSLSSFDLDRTDMDLFSGNRYMKSVKELGQSIDSMKIDQSEVHFKLYSSVATSYRLIMGGYIPPSEELVAMQYKKDSLSRLRTERDSLSKVAELPEVSEAPNVDSTIGRVALDTTELDSLKGKKAPKKYVARPSVAAGGSVVQEREMNKEQSISSVMSFLENKKEKKLKNDSLMLTMAELDTVKARVDTFFLPVTKNKQVATKALSIARGIKSSINSSINRTTYFKRAIDSHTVERYKKYAQSFACIVMFLIGAPLGAIIKRGGLGMPVIVGVVFFIIFYVFTSASDKWAKGGIVDGLYAAWMADAVLLPFGVFFLIQAWKDAKLFDTDFYNVIIERAMRVWGNRQELMAKFTLKRR